MRQPIAIVISLFFLFCGLNVIPAQAGEEGPSWFAWGQAWFHDDQGEDVNGEDVSSTFLVKRARFGIKGWASDKWFYHFMIDGAGSPTLMQAWVDYKCMPELKIRVGQFKHGFGREALPSATTWKFINPSHIVGRLGKYHVDNGSAFRDQGIMVYGDMMTGEMSVDYSVFLMNGSGINVPDTDGKKDIVGHVGIKLPAGLAAGATFYKGENGNTELGRGGFGVDVCYAKDKIWVMGEFIGGTMEQGADVDDLKMAGYYTGATYMATEDIEAGVRFDAYDPNTDQDDDGDSRITLGASYYLAKLNRITLNFEIPSAEDEDVELDPVIIVQFQGSLK